MGIGAALALCLEVCGGAGAAEPPTVGGYFDTRLIYSAPRLDGLAPTDQLPNLVSLTEANTQARVPFNDHGFFAADTSLFYQAAGLYYVRLADGTPRKLADHDVPAYQPFVLINEMYLSFDLGEWANFTLGKKRLLWGPGLLLNPSDMLNPAKDPTDPTFQRAGAYLARLEFPTEHVTFTFLGAARARREVNGLPSSLLYDPPYSSYAVAHTPGSTPDFDRTWHGLLMARLYALLADTDINLFYAFGNLYNDAFTSKSRFGLTLSHAFGRLELHAEGLLQQGSARFYLDPTCTDSIATVSQCEADNTLLIYPLLHDGKFRTRALVGLVLSLPADSVVALEYFYNGEGYDAANFLAAAKVLQLAYAAGVSGDVAQVSQPGGLQKFTFLGTRHHYLLASVLRPHLGNYVNLSAVAIANLEDLSWVLAPAIQVTPRDNVTVTLYGFGIFGQSPGGQTPIDGHSTSEFGLLPFTWRALMSVRASY